MCLEILLHKTQSSHKGTRSCKTTGMEVAAERIGLLLLNKQLTHNRCPGHMVLCKITRVISATSIQTAILITDTVPIHF